MQTPGPTERPKQIKELIDQFTSGLAKNIGFQSAKGWQAPLVPVAFLLTLSWILATNIPAPIPELSLIAFILGFGGIGYILFNSSKEAFGTAPLLLLALLCLGFLWHRISFDFPIPGVFTTTTLPDTDYRIYQLSVLDRTESRSKNHRPEWANDPRVFIPCELESVSDAGMATTASGKVLVRCPGPAGHMIPGEKITVTARFKPFSAPLNPGEPMPYLWWRRKGYVGILDSRKPPIAIESKYELISSLVPNGFGFNIFKNTLETIKDWAEQRLEKCIGAENPESNLAKALILGDTQTVDLNDWDKFKKTGTIHALAISGQHLVIAGALVGILLTFLGFPPRPSLIISTLFVVFYAVLTGAAPSANRAAIMAVAFAWTLLIRRRTSILNIIALAWILVCLVQPSDLATPGCQLSFLAVFLLDTWQRRQDYSDKKIAKETPGQKLDQLESQLAPYWTKFTKRAISTIRESFFVNCWVWLGICPLIAWHTNLVSLVALIIGPLVAIACTGGLICGMIGILIPIPFFENLFGTGLIGFLKISNLLADMGESYSLSWFYLPNISFFGLVGWLIFLGWIALPEAPRISWRTIFTGSALLVILLISPFLRWPPKDLLIHSMAIGHGTAILVEDPNGRVLLYDGGSMAGGESTAKKISHVLWHLGISAIDEIIVSHADADHFNALTGIMEKFRVGMVSIGPSFTNRDDKETSLFFEKINLRGIPLRKIFSGLNAISGLTIFEILYPDQDYTNPPNQNAGSIVVRIGYMGKSLLLTGDLEPPGTDFFLAKKDLSPVSILMAPHHGSPSANPEKLWRKLNPGFVFSSEGDEKRSKIPGGLWGREIPYWKTQEKGMITIKFNQDGIWVSSFKTRESLKVKENKVEN